eukprot:915102-Amphidinium_carterae.1
MENLGCDLVRDPRVRGATVLVGFLYQKSEHRDQHVQIHLTQLCHIPEAPATQHQEKNEPPTPLQEPSNVQCQGSHKGGGGKIPSFGILDDSDLYQKTKHIKLKLIPRTSCSLPHGTSTQHYM